MTSQQDPLQSWRGEFGAAYRERNRSTDDAVRQATEFFGRVLGQTGIAGELNAVVEVGANIGINLRGLRRLLGDRVGLTAVEPNHVAAQELRESELDLAAVHETTAASIPTADAAFDLAFTNGVLIHIPPDSLAEAVDEIVRVSGRYVLCSEYFSTKPVEDAYRGHDGLLWKRDFGRYYLERHPSLQVRGYGFVWSADLPAFDDLTWWLFEKQHG